MLIQEKISRRFEELETQMGPMQVIKNGVGRSFYEAGAWRQWSTSALSLIQAAFGESSVQFTNFRTKYDICVGYTAEVDALKGIFRAAKADFDGGYLFSVEASISGEIFGDFVGLAKAALHEGSKDVAAVLACAALEDALKRYAGLNGLVVNDKVMQEVVGAIKAKGLVTGAQKSLLDTMPKIRDYAMHANWEKITAQDVGSVIGFVEQFLLTHFS
jgi:hypothetical protein